MAITLTSLSDLATLGFDTIIDARAPAEYAEDHLPGAISLPVLSDEERAKVGTIYTQVSPFTARKLGGALVERLCEAGWPVTVCDTDPLRQQQALAAGASLADSPLSAVAQLGPRDALVIVVVDADQCREVLWGEEGASVGMRPGQAVVLCPTIAPEDTVSIAQRLAAQGIDCIDAPMSGGPQRARDGRMSLMVAAPAAVLDRHADPEILGAVAGNDVVLIAPRHISRTRQAHAAVVRTLEQAR